MHSKAIVGTAGLLFGLVLAGAALAKPPLQVPSLTALDAGDGIVSKGEAIAAPVIYTNGFEPGEGFAPGPVEPQAGWTASGTNDPWASVATPNPFTGIQHLRLVKRPASAAGAQLLVLSPSWGPLPPGSSTTSVRLDISNDGGADYDVFGQAPSQGFIAWRVKFHFEDPASTGPGTILVLDLVGTTLVFVNTGVPWTQGAYAELVVQLDIAAGNINYFYNNVLIHTGSIIAATVVEQIGAITDNYQLANETFDVDGASVVNLGDPPVAVEATSWSRIKSMMR